MDAAAGLPVMVANQPRTVQLDMEKTFAVFGISPDRDMDRVFFGSLLREAMTMLGAGAGALVRIGLDGDLGGEEYYGGADGRIRTKQFHPPAARTPFIANHIETIWAQPGITRSAVLRGDDRAGFEAYREEFAHPEVTSIDEICIPLRKPNGERQGVLVLGRPVTPNRSPFAIRNVVLAAALGVIISAIIESRVGAAGGRKGAVA